MAHAREALGPAEPAPGAAGPVLLYDGECPLCERTSAWLLAQAPPGARREAFQTLAPEAAARARAAGIERAVLVAAAPGAPWDGGLDAALRFVAGGRPGALLRLLAARPLRPLLRPLYALLAHHRRVLSPPAAFAPRLEPPPHWGLDLAFPILLAAGVAGLASALGAVVFPAFGLGPAGQGARWALAFWGFLLVGQALCAPLAPRGRRRVALAHATFATALCLAPSLVLLLAAWLPRAVAVVLACLSLGLGVRTLLLRHIRAQERLGLGVRHTWGALVALWLALGVGIALVA